VATAAIGTHPYLTVRPREALLAEARGVDTHAVHGAVVETRRGLAVVATPVDVALAHSANAQPMLSTLHRACGLRAVVARVPVVALALGIVARPTTRAHVWTCAILARLPDPPSIADASAVPAEAVSHWGVAVVGAQLERALAAAPPLVTQAPTFDACAMQTRALESLAASAAREARVALAQPFLTPSMATALLRACHVSTVSPKVTGKAVTHSFVTVPVRVALVGAGHGGALGPHIAVGAHTSRDGRVPCAVPIAIGSSWCWPCEDACDLAHNQTRTNQSTALHSV